MQSLRCHRYYRDKDKPVPKQEQPYFRYGDVTMKNLSAITILTFGLCLTANADICKWADGYGKTHIVNTNTPIYTWLDEYGKVHYSDRPEHESAASVELVRHSTGDLVDTEGANGSAVASRGKEIDPNEPVDERIERKMPMRIIAS